MLDEMMVEWDPWSMLQQPYHACSGVSAGYRSLLAALDLGWQVEEPVQIESFTRMGSQTYRFTLRHPVIKQDCFIHVPVIPEVEKTIERNHYSVIPGNSHLFGAV